MGYVLLLVEHLDLHNLFSSRVQSSGDILQQRAGSRRAQNVQWDAAGLQDVNVIAAPDPRLFA